MACQLEVVLNAPVSSSVEAEVEGPKIPGQPGLYETLTQNSNNRKLSPPPITHNQKLSLNELYLWSQLPSA